MSVLLNSTTFFLNKSRTKYVSVGLSVGSHYNPVIHLCGNRNQHVSFHEEDWNLFLQYQGLITNYLFSNEDTREWNPITLNHKTLHFETFNSRRNIKIVDKDVVLWLGSETVFTLWELLPLIINRMEILKKQEFFVFYDNLIRNLCTMSGDIIENVQFAMKPFAVNVNSYCIKELIHYAPKVFAIDVDIKKVEQDLYTYNKM
jgi:hypothetical protein